MEIIVRRASDDFEAFQTAAAMEHAGASVISITSWVSPKTKQLWFCVFAKYDPEKVTIKQIDKQIEFETCGETNE